jgi:thiol-disulfide isomerase/thioredoxin
MRFFTTTSLTYVSLAVLGLAVLLLVGSVVLYLVSERGGEVYPSLVHEQYREIREPGGFLNTEPVTIEELLKTGPVLIEFMSYTCVNCQRSFPHLVHWNETYEKEGLHIVGIHTPEYAFEKEIENVRGAMEKSEVTFPVVLDNSYATWNAYGNRFWPRTFLIAQDGTIVYDHVGGGNYDETEAAIQSILKD